MIPVSAKVKKTVAEQRNHREGRIQSGAALGILVASPKRFCEICKFHAHILCFPCVEQGYTPQTKLRRKVRVCPAPFARTAVKVTGKG
jgi:hypothetical protein